jgi:hypothetical protein
LSIWESIRILWIKRYKDISIQTKQTVQSKRGPDVKEHDMVCVFESENYLEYKIVYDFELCHHICVSFGHNNGLLFTDREKTN